MNVLNLTGHDKYVTSTVHSFITNLPELLHAMINDGQRTICIAELSDGHYVQFLTTSITIFIEVESNQFLDDANCLSSDDEDLLRTMGFNEPSPERSPNWHCEVKDPRDIIGATVTIASVMELVFHALGNDPVRIKTFFGKQR